MSKRFPPFNRMLHEMLHPPRLHPAMRERMWVKGQSGNPSGMNEVTRLARERAEAAAERHVNPSPGAMRTRRARQRKQRGVVIVNVEVTPDLTAGLIRLDWLDAAMAGDKKAIAAALLRLAEAAIGLGVAQDLFDNRPFASEK
jgi:hypothetical protein